MRDRRFLASALLGLGVIAMTIVLAALGPRVADLPQGFMTPVLALEFAASPQDVRQILGPAGSDAARAMDIVNTLDFVYIALYGGFLISLAYAVWRETGNRQYLVVLALAPVVMAADTLENIHLLSMTGLLDQPDASISAVLRRLSVATWVKWGGLSLALLGLASYFWRLPSVWRWIAVACAAPLALGIAAYVRRGILNELFALVIGLAFLLMTAYAWWRVLRVARIVAAAPAG